MVALDSFYPMTGVTTQLAQWQKFAPNYFGDGVIYGTLNAFSVAQHAPPGMSVDVATGQCFIQGVFGENGSTKTLTIATADNTNPRIDRVVIRCDTVAQDLEVLVLTGVAAVSPSPPALIRSATQTDYSVCQVLVGTTVTSIVTGNVTDEREYAGPRGIPVRGTLAAATTIQPYGPSPLTEGPLLVPISGTTTITSIATGQTPPKAGALLILEFLSSGCSVAAGGNVGLGRTYTSGAGSSAPCALLALLWTGTGWLEVARSSEQAPAHQYLGNPTGTVTGVTFASIVAADLPGYGSVTFGSLTQGVGVAYTQNSGRATQFGKLWQAHGQFSPSGTGTAGTAALLALPAGIAFNLGAGDQAGTWRIDQAASIGGILGVTGGGTGCSFAVPGPTSQTFWGVTPNVSLNATTTIWVSIIAEIV